MEPCRDCRLPRIRNVERCEFCEVASLFTAEMLRRHEAWDTALAAAHFGCETAHLDRPPHPGLLAAYVADKAGSS
jgi:hypothetical protein